MRRGGSGRGSKAARRFDPAALRELVADGRVWTRLARVVADQQSGGVQYSRETDDAGNLVDVLVEFETLPDGARVTARMTSLGGNAARGVFFLPDVGEEWMLHFHDGQLGEALTGMSLSGGKLPAAAGQATTTNLVICAQQVVITDPAGGGELPAARKTDPVKVTIPVGTVIVSATGGVTNATPIDLSGTIQDGSLVLKVK